MCYILQIFLLIHAVFSENTNKKSYNNNESETLKIVKINDNLIKSYSTIRTIELTKSNNKKVLHQNRFKDKLRLKIGNEVVYANYYGEGHTKDNIVGVIPSEKTLFCGCLIKELNSSKGNLADANTENWARIVERIKSEFPEIINVVPGHGKIGRRDLLDYIIKLFTIN